MDRRGWPWKKKSSEKNLTEKPVSPSDSAGMSLARAMSLGNQDCKKVNYVQISLDSFKHLSGLEELVSALENQVNTLENQVKDLEGKLSTAHLELSTKENLVKQHAKVAEEAVSGWENADAEVHALKQELESVTLFKLVAEDRVSHLDGALKECTRQIRNVKEESELQLQQTILAKTKQWDQLKLDFEAKMVELDRALLQAGVENAALSRSLQEHFNTIMTTKEEKSKAEAEVELLKANIQLRDKEINSLKYELHVVSEELDIRNQEKNMNLKAAEAANKQHLENVGRITKLEAECQRLRGLVRKKLPGPAALARMKLEAKIFSQDWNEPSLLRNSMKYPVASLSSKSHLTNDDLKQCHKESEFQGKRFLEMEEEIKTLKEALGARNTELQVSRSMYAKTMSRVKILEAQILAPNQQAKSSGSGVQIEGFSREVVNTPPSVTSISEDGIDEGSSTGSWGPLISDISQLWKDKSMDKSSKSSSANPLELMDDFLEMEKLACSSADSVLSTTGLDSSKCARDTASVDAIKNVNPTANQNSSPVKIELQSVHSRFSELLPRICTMVDRQTLEVDVKELLEDVKQALGPDALHLPSESQISKEACTRDPMKMIESEVSLADCHPNISTDIITNKELGAAVSQIHQFVLSLGREAAKSHGTSCSNRCLAEKALQDFTASVEKFRSNSSSLVNFVLELSSILTEAREIDSGISDYADHDEDPSSGDCIDKVPLLERKVIQDESSESGKTPYSPCELMLQDLDGTKLQLQETEQVLASLKSQMESSQRDHSLAEVQLKCMTESYKLLEARARDLEAEVKVLHDKAEKLENELLEEKHQHRGTLATVEDLQQKFKREFKCSVCSLSTAAESHFKTKQEREIAIAAEKLAECQETIYLLSRQLQALRSPSDTKGLQANEGNLVEDGTSLSR
ncbi:filament-like plant protein 5 [Punica granatum]|nr:filament-like plant protein 5 [Punica granatum]PKI78065.1 hypothetical protein CRG98_001515 [Punica granatum]